MYSADDIFIINIFVLPVGIGATCFFYYILKHFKHEQPPEYDPSRPPAYEDIV